MKFAASLRPSLSSIKALAIVAALLALMRATAPAAITNAILFVTQVPIPNEVNDGTVSNVFVSVVSALGNHLADTTHAGRGGDLWIRYPSGAISNLTRLAGYTKILSGTPSNGVFAANFSGPTTRATVLEATTDFQAWTPVATNASSTNGIFLLNDPGMTNYPYRFYRGKVP